MNATVERNGFFEIRAERFSPNITDSNFIGIVCGYQFAPRMFSPFTKWVKFSINSMVLNSVLPPDYHGRITITDKTALRIHNAEFSDEGTTFYCTLEFLNKDKFDEIHRTVKLKTVYGEHNFLYAVNFCQLHVSFSSKLDPCPTSGRPPASFMFSFLGRSDFCPAIFSRGVGVLNKKIFYSFERKMLENLDLS